MKTARYLFYGILLLLFHSCQSEEMLTDFEKENIQSLENAQTHSSVRIIICTDAYVDVGAYSDYKGTTCKAETVDMGNDFELEPGTYQPDGYPHSGGTGGSFEKGTSWYFNFHLLEKIYNRSSNFNLLEKQALQEVIELFNSQPDPYKAIYTHMVSRTTPVKVNFILDPHCSQPAIYIKESSDIRVKNAQYITFYYIAEEFLHAVQHQSFYHEQMNPKYKNYEFEVYVFRDLAYGIANKIALNDPDKPYYPGVAYTAFPDPDDPYHSIYQKWIDDLINYGYFPIGEQTTFNQICSHWKAIKGEVLSDFYPQLLRTFFNKPQKP